MSTEAWIRQWFAARGHASAQSLLSTDDFLAGGAIDSFVTIQLVGAIESEFGIQFGQDDFQNPRFTTMDGLARIVDELIKNRNAP